MKKLAKAMIATVTLGLSTGGAIFAINHVKLQRPLDQVVDSDSRNAGISVRVHYSEYIPGKTLVYDLREFGATSTPADVFRVLLQYAEAMKLEKFDRVELAFRGDTKFVLDGQSFRTLGVEYADQNPVYTIRTFPEKLRTRRDDLPSSPGRAGCSAWRVRR